jgi:hypothetical protein
MLDARLVESTYKVKRSYSLYLVPGYKTLSLSLSLRLPLLPASLEQLPSLGAKVYYTLRWILDKRVGHAKRSETKKRLILGLIFLSLFDADG